MKPHLSSLPPFASSGPGGELVLYDVEDLFRYFCLFFTLLGALCVVPPLFGQEKGGHILFLYVVELLLGVLEGFRLYLYVVGTKRGGKRGSLWVFSSF